MKRVKKNRLSKKGGPADVALRRYRAHYERLKRELRHVGFVCLGSITQRWILCGKPACVCHRDPAQRHGPYYYWTRKIHGKTQGHLLNESLVRLYKQGIQNHRRLDAILDKMREVSLSAFQAARIHSKG